MNTTLRVSLQNAFVIHSRPYRESSSLLEVFSCDYGKVALVAKGVRKKRSRLGAVLQPFNPLRVSWSGKGDLYTLTGAEIVPPGIRLTGRNLYCGFYLNELLTYFLHRHDPHQVLFSHYTAALAALCGNAKVEETLRYFELALLNETGFGLRIESDPKSMTAIRPDCRYEYRVGQGLVELKDSQDGFAGSTLLGLAHHDLQGSVQLTESKRLMRQIIDHHLAGKKLRSRALFKKHD